MIVVVCIVMILAAAAITGSAGILRNLRFGNAFNKIVLMVQSARGLAVTGKNSYDTPITSYDVRFNLSASQSVDIFANGPNVVVETYTIEATTGLQIFANELENAAAPTPCSGLDPAAVLSFAQNSAALTLTCGGTPRPLMQFGIQEGAGGTSKTFLIHQAAGIPQVQ